MSQYGVDYLQRLRAAVEKFEEAFNAWMDTQVESDHMSSRGLFPTVWTKEGQDSSTVQRLELDVAEAAGLAASAVAVTGAYIAIAGLGAIDPISNWSFMSSPKAPITPRDIRTTTANVKGRLDAMVADAEARTDADLPAFAPSQFHPVVWSGASAHWTTHQYRVAVREAAEGLTVHWKNASAGAMSTTPCSGSRLSRRAHLNLENRNWCGLVPLMTRRSRVCGVAWNLSPRHSMLSPLD